jgi:hypothetical protein
MRFAEHDLIAGSSLRFRSEKIRYPPGAGLPDEEQAVANDEPVVSGYGRLKCNRLEHSPMVHGTL